MRWRKALRSAFAVPGGSQPTGTLTADLTVLASASGATRDSEPPSEFFDHLLKDMVIQDKDGPQLFEQSVFTPQLTQPPPLQHAEVGAHFLPDIKGGPGHPELPADLSNRRADLYLAQDKDDLLFSEYRIFLRHSPTGKGPFAAALLYL